MYMAINDEHGDIESEGIQPGLSPPHYIRSQISVVGSRPGNLSAIHYTLSNPIY